MTDQREVRRYRLPIPCEAGNSMWETKEFVLASDFDALKAERDDWKMRYMDLCINTGTTPCLTNK